MLIIGPNVKVGRACKQNVCRLSTILSNLIKVLFQHLVLRVIEKFKILVILF